MASATLLVLFLSRFPTYLALLILSSFLLPATSAPSSFLSATLRSPICSPTHPPIVHLHIAQPGSLRRSPSPLLRAQNLQDQMAPTLYYTRDTPAPTGFHPEPSGRGTIGIIWTCLSTILLSSWSSFHYDAYDPNKSFKSEGRNYYSRKVLFAFLFPEVVAVESFDNLYEALQLRKTVRLLGGPQFTHFSLSQAFLFVMQGVYQKSAGSEHTLVDGDKLVQLVRNGSLSLSDLPTDDEIADKSKRDWTLKSISIIQTLWFITSVIARLSRGYPVSLYEDITAANAFCGIVAFCCWFRCPQDIRLPFTITPTIPGKQESSATTEGTEPEQEATVHTSLLISENGTDTGASSGPHLSVLADTSEDRPNGELPTMEQPPFTKNANESRTSFAIQDAEYQVMSINIWTIILLVFGVLFAGIHIAAWNYSFPSVTEAWIWRGSSLALTLLGVLLSVGVNKAYSVNVNSVFYGIYILIFLLYALVRTMMLVIALMSFRKAPARLYETPSWTQYWPHI